MNLTNLPWVTIVTFLPLVGAFILLFQRREDANTLKQTALVFSVLTFIASLGFLFGGFKSELPGFQFHEQIAWIPAFNIGYEVGIDGISLLLVLLTTFITPLAILSSWKAITDRLKEYMIFLLILVTGLVGGFVGLDMFLVWVFWEGTLVPMYCLLGTGGGLGTVYAPL